MSERKRIFILESIPSRSAVYSEVLSDIAELEFCTDDEPNLDVLLSTSGVPSLMIVPIALICEGRLMERCQQRGWSPTIFAVGDGISFEHAMMAFDRGVADVLNAPIESAGVLRTKALRLVHKGVMTGADLEELPELTMKEYRIVRAILTAPDGRVLRPALVRKVWPDMNISPKTIDVHIFNLRRKLRRRGYDIKSRLDDGRSFSLEPLVDGGLPEGGVGS